MEELICWHEDFDSREYTRSSQRHAATLEHGQREIRSIVGSVLLTQLRTNYHNHLAQVRLRWRLRLRLVDGETACSVVPEHKLCLRRHKCQLGTMQHVAKL